MRKLRDFKCTLTHKLIERLAYDNTNIVTCLCGNGALKQVSAPKCFSNTVGRSPSAK